MPVEKLKLSQIMQNLGCSHCGFSYCSPLHSVSKQTGIRNTIMGHTSLNGKIFVYLYGKES
jgi:hypothetical protein